MGEGVVEIARDGSATPIVIQAVPAGTYAEFGIEIMVADASASGAMADFGGAQPASILVEGSYDDAPFTYRSTVAPELEWPLSPPAEVVDGGEARISVTFDVAAWFLAGDGSALDPADPGSRNTIEGNIRNSMAAYTEPEDDD